MNIVGTLRHSSASSVGRALALRRALTSGLADFVRLKSRRHGANMAGTFRVRGKEALPVTAAGIVLPETGAEWNVEARRKCTIALCGLGNAARLF
jgi:hypothetical protein